MRKTEVRENESPDPVPHALTSLDRCLVDGDPAVVSRGKRSRCRALGLSLAIESALLGLVILAPLMTGAALPKVVHGDLDIVTVGLGRRIGNRPPQRPPVPNRPPRPTNEFSPAIFAPIAPIRPMPPNDPGPEPGIEGVEVGLDAGPLGPSEPVPLELPKPVAPMEHSAKNPERQPLKMSEGVVEAQLISRVEPRYPPLALETRAQGTVRLEAIISREGRITSLVVLSGHPLLVQAALDAVRQWRYWPTMLDGGPVEVETTITVVFQLQN